MGKPTGFLEYLRELPLDRPALERIKDWNEFHNSMDPKALRTQAARCMDCGIPWCHTGAMIGGMASGCPIHNLIPEWNDLIFRGLWREALERLHKTNNFPDFTGRVCPAPCEGACTVGKDGLPVTIKNIEVSIIDKGWEEGWVVPQPPAKRTGKKVAVVGSGPAGLCAAAQLNRVGHSVTVFERADRPGGLLMYGIPNMKLDKEKIVLRRIQQMEAEGVVFVCDTEVGKDLSVEQLRKDFDAVALCAGATQARDLPMEGRELKGIHLALEFLGSNTKALLDKTAAPITAAGKHVIVIGGGDTGTDCVGTSIRHGAVSVTQVEIMPKPPLERAANNPWPEWPKVLKTDYGQEEAAAKFGADPRIFLTTAKRFIGDACGNVRQVHLVQIEWKKDDKGRFTPQEVPGSDKIVPAELVLLALGFVGPEKTLPDALKLDRDARGNIKADFEKYTTNVPGVFAAGDCRRGQSLVVWAFNEGRGVAREIDRHLMGATDLP
jgi:glutamate synthase (NADPH/NADH) small chain